MYPVPLVSGHHSLLLEQADDLLNVPVELANTPPALNMKRKVQEFVETSSKVARARSVEYLAREERVKAEEEWRGSITSVQEEQ